MITDNERTVLITGASQGIGYGIAQNFIDNGDFVAVLDLKNAQEAAEELGNAKGYKVDITDEENVKEAVQQITDERGTIDVLVNNAGVQHISKVEEFPLEKWNMVINVILTGTFLMTKHVVPAMKEQQSGRIINISSAHGRIADPYKSAYVSAKFAQIGFTQTVALETAEEGITCNAILPGPVRTKLIENQLSNLAEQDGTSEQEALDKHILGKMPMNRLLEPSEIGSTAVYLASEGAAAITGEGVAVSGGTGI